VAVLKSAKHNSWKNVIALDDSFFYMHTEFEQMQFPRDEAPETRECHMINSEKLMVTIAWNCNGFHAIEVLPKKQKCNANYYCSSVLTKLSKMARQIRNQT
jgi:hypothetical protein